MDHRMNEKIYDDRYFGDDVLESIMFDVKPDDDIDFGEDFIYVDPAFYLDDMWPALLLLVLGLIIGGGAGVMMWVACYLIYEFYKAFQNR